MDSFDSDCCLVAHSKKDNIAIRAEPSIIKPGMVETTSFVSDIRNITVPKYVCIETSADFGQGLEAKFLLVASVRQSNKWP